MLAWLEMYRVRDRVFGQMPEPQWRMLVDMAVNGPCQITSACIASGAPATTALRHVGELERAGLIVREPHCEDRRKFMVALTDKAIANISQSEAA